jgi:RimJ/RimL family protein N-acetyltransferase
MPQSGWTLTGPEGRFEFADLVRPVLELDPVGNTNILTSVARLPTDERPPHTEDCYGYWTDDAGRIRAAFVAPHPYAVTLSARFPAPAAAELPPAWQASGRARPAGVFGGAETAERVAADWAKLTGGRYRALPQRAFRLFSFDEPTPPDPAPRGEARHATPDEAELATVWDVAFCEECGFPASEQDRAPFVRGRIAERRQLMWTVDSVPVAQAVYTPITAGTTRIVGVYTPPERRRNGYAAGLAWAISQQALADGAERVVLHTDLSNPTSNAIYQRLGYRPVQDSTEFELAD